jgi:hypothetical protein
MGLDMHLKAKRYIWYNELDLERNVRQFFSELPISATIDEVRAEIGYWRKANAIHKWFVAHVQEGVDDCGEYGVDRELLVSLRDTCAQVLEDTDLAPTLLPTQTGFFFGDTHYDDGYLANLRSTMQICNSAIALPKDWTIYYRSFW